MNATIEIVTESVGQKIVGWLEFLGITLGYSLLAGLAVVAIFYIGIHVLGFTCWGVALGTCAAICQAKIGNVIGGSCFANMQKIAAGGSYILPIVLYIVGSIATFTLLVIIKVNQEEHAIGSAVDSSSTWFNSAWNSSSATVDSAVNSSSSWFNSAKDSSLPWLNSAVNSSSALIDSVIDSSSSWFSSAMDSSFSWFNSAKKATESLINNTVE
ncbi:hypothetical protein JTE90_015958 [Oedothorax gibbosus]|uniref:Uncharacterized protein n=1 Tax=Oedothorax gibbosus TaxID=931172 RepID=A0AAV6U160_9ARAC|nr:hypothetical protein JTE90_015958 [Oedothorax gibbosus]